MFESFVKQFFMFLSSFYLYDRILNLKSSRKLVLMDICFSAFTSLLLQYIKLYVPNLAILITILVFFIFIMYTRQTPINISFVTSVIVFGSSYFFFFIATLIMIPFAIFLISFTKEEEVWYFVTFPMLGIVQLFVSSVPFRVKRFKNGMPFLLKKSSNSIGICICAAFILFATFYGVRKDSNYIIAIAICFTAIFGILLFVWWKKQLTKTYREKLSANELASPEQEIENLKRDNERLSKIIHKDNKLIPAMMMAVKNTLESYASLDTNGNTAQKLYMLLDTLKKLSEERTGILSSYETELVNFASTDSIRLDALLNTCIRKCLQNR